LRQIFQTLISKQRRKAISMVTSGNAEERAIIFHFHFHIHKTQS